MWQAFLTMALLHWVVLVTPGVNFFLLVQLAASGKRRNALATVFGITAMTFTWALCAVLGLSTLFHFHPGLRQAMQVAGGLYLCHLAWKLWRTPRHSGEVSAPSAVVVSDLSTAAAFRRGFITNLLNPKTALFFGSVFATALPAHMPAIGWAAAVAIVYVNALVWHLFLALAFSQPQVQRAYQRQQRTLGRASAVFLGGFGVKLLNDTFSEWRTRAA